jgi:hypothetical protein
MTAVACRDLFETGARRHQLCFRTTLIIRPQGVSQFTNFVQTGAIRRPDADLIS